jgi:glycosyltransferase involved in cell wall biosynthesis
MAAGLPVIATHVGGIPELIEDGVEGYLIAPGDVEALADRITRLIRDPSERRRMGERGQSKARKFDEKLVLARLGAQLRLASSRTP